MLAQVVSQTAYLRSPSGTIQVRRGTLLFVAKKDVTLCTVTYKDHVYTVHISHLMFVEKEEEVLLPVEIQEMLDRKEQERLRDIQSQFDKL
jgi:hypothetical protein